MSNIKIDRLEKLRQADIVNYTSTINFDNILEFHEDLLRKVFEGKFDDIFLTNKLDGLSNDDKKSVFNTARNYKSLCFYAGDFNYWLDSIDGVYLSDVDLVCIKLLDNYDFLLGLIRKGGNDSLKLLTDFQKNNLYDRGSVIDGLRNSFINDEVLENIVIEMSKPDGKYANFSDTQKMVLMSAPDGILYRLNDSNDVELVDIYNKIKETITGEDVFNLNDADFQRLLKGLSSTEFSEVIDEISGEYRLGSNEKIKRH